MTDIPYRDEIDQVLVENVLYPIWRTIDGDFKAKYARTMWQMFEDRARVVSHMTRSLPQFITDFTRFMRATPANSGDAAAVLAEVGAYDDRALMAVLRRDTAFLVALLRVLNDAHRAEQ